MKTINFLLMKSYKSVSIASSVTRRTEMLVNVGFNNAGLKHAVQIIIERISRDKLTFW